MKKMFFTVIALVAFSATSMANTVEVKEVVIPVDEKEETNIEIEDVLRSRCDAIWLLAFLDHGGGKNYEEAVFYADLATDAAGGCQGAWN